MNLQLQRTLDNANNGTVKRKQRGCERREKYRLGAQLEAKMLKKGLVGESEAWEGRWENRGERIVQIEREMGDAIEAEEGDRHKKVMYDTNEQ